MITSSPGTYMLLLTLPEQTELQIGRTRRICFDAGLYCYAGSALGPGGLAARLNRHAAGSKRQHWHIDYLLPFTRLLGALAIEYPRRLECSWAEWAGHHAGACISGFGSSDCNCPSHLFWIGPSVDTDHFIARAQQDLRARYALRDELTKRGS